MGFRWYRYRTLRCIVKCNEKWILFLYDNHKRGGKYMDNSDTLTRFNKPKLIPEILLFSVYWGLSFFFRLSPCTFFLPDETTTAITRCAQRNTPDIV